MSIIDRAKEIADLIKKLDDIELYRKIVELEGEIFELTRANRGLEDEVSELKQVLTASKEMRFKKPLYYSGDDPQPYCPKCWEVNKRAVHLFGPKGVAGRTYFTCPNCSTIIN